MTTNEPADGHTTDLGRLTTAYQEGQRDRSALGRAVGAGEAVDVDRAEYEAVRSLRAIRERVEEAEYESQEELATDMRAVARAAGQWTGVSPLVDRELRRLHRGSWGERAHQEPQVPPSQLFNLADVKAHGYANEQDLEYEPRSGFGEATDALLDRSFTRLEEDQTAVATSRLREAGASLERTVQELQGRSQSPGRSEDPGRSHGAVPFEQHAHGTGPTLER